MSPPPPDVAVYADRWALDPAVAMLNHGSFGACPRAVLEHQQRLRAEMERDPVAFFYRRAQPLLDESRAALVSLVGCPADDLVFVRNVTAAVGSVLRSLPFEPGDELLVTDHSYNACRNAVEFVAQRCRARVVVVSISLPIESPEQVVDAILTAVTPRTRLAMIDHVTSPTAVVFPIERIVAALNERGVDTLVDGAHAPGMVPLDIGRLGAAYYGGNLHKWTCVPKGAGFLYVRPDRQAAIQPPVISHAYNTPRRGYSRFQDAFDWTGTDDPTPWLCVAEALRFLEGLVDSEAPCAGECAGLQGLMRRNRELTLWARRMLCRQLGLQPVCPEEMLGAMAAMRLPDDVDPANALDTTTAITAVHRWYTELYGRHGIQVPIYHWPCPPHKLLRISVQAYNAPSQYERLAEAVGQLLEDERPAL